MQKQNQMRNVLDTDRIGPLLLTLTMPAFFGMLVQTLYNVVNTIFLGQAVGSLAIAGTTIVFPVQMMLMGLGMMVGMGGTSMISRFLGSREHEKAERTLGNGITCIIIISLAITAILLPNVNGFLRLIGASEDVLPYARPYLLIVVGGTVFNLIGMALLNFIRAEGNARVPMIGNIMGAVINFLLDWLFIIGMDMGVVGAALGTVIAQFIVLIYLSYFYLSKNSYLKFRKVNLRLDKTILKPMLTIGVSSFVQTTAGSISAMFLMNTVISYGGDIYLSAFGIIQRVMMFATMPAMVIGQGVQPILGFNYGARRFSLAVKAFKMAAIYSTVFSTAAFCLLYLIPGAVASIFTSDPALIEASAYASKLVFWSMPIMGFVMLGTNSFISLGKATQAFITAIARPALFLIPSVLILSNLFGLQGVFFSCPASDALTLALTIVLLIPIFKEFRQSGAAEKQGLPAAGMAPLQASRPAPDKPAPDND
jgi:putative MATE family efflux protein